MTATPDLVPEAPEVTGPIEEVLRLVHLSSAVFLRGEFTAPWAFTSLEPTQCAAALCPGAERLVLFHILLEGRCRIWLDTGEEAFPAAGEAVVLPYGDCHSMGHPEGVAPVPIAGLLPAPPFDRIPELRHGGGGVPTRVLCGYFQCQDLLFQPVLRALPPLIHVRPSSAPAAEWLGASARYTLAEAGRGLGPSSRLPELLLVDCLRQYLRALPPARAGWLAALRDPVVGRAVWILHQAPAEPWTVDRLARRVAVSRSVLGERFGALLGAPPMRYLALWRLQLAAHLLRTTAATLPEVAGRVGYESEAAFSRAFKRQMGLPPATFRTRPPRSGAPTPVALQ